NSTKGRQRLCSRALVAATVIQLAPPSFDTFATRSSKNLSPDHLVSAQKEPLGDVQPEGLGSGQIDDQIELGRLLDAQISRLCRAQNLVHIFGGAPEHTREIWPIGHQTSGLDEFPKVMHRR